jgi:hypothetical protein
MRRLRHRTGQHRIAFMNLLLGRVPASSAPASQVRANQLKLPLFASLRTAFVTGIVVGAVGFKVIGFIWFVPRAVLLLGLSFLPPLSRLAAHSAPQGQGH